MAPRVGESLVAQAQLTCSTFIRVALPLFERALCFQAKLSQVLRLRPWPRSAPVSLYHHVLCRAVIKVQIARSHELRTPAP